MTTPQSGTLRGPRLKFTGYAALWDRPDRAGDVFRRGAFADGTVPLLWQHRGVAVGRVEARTDAIGLNVSGEIDESRIADLVRCGALDGLSVGYHPRVVQVGAWREILHADLAEVSLVAQPMQPGARVTAVWETPGPARK